MVLLTGDPIGRLHIRAPAVDAAYAPHIRGDGYGGAAVARELPDVLGLLQLGRGIGDGGEVERLCFRLNGQSVL